MTSLVMSHCSIGYNHLSTIHHHIFLCQLKFRLCITHSMMHFKDSTSLVLIYISRSIHHRLLNCHPRNFHMASKCCLHKLENICFINFHLKCKSTQVLLIGSLSHMHFKRDMNSNNFLNRKLLSLQRLYRRHKEYCMLLVANKYCSSILSPICSLLSIHLSCHDSNHHRPQINQLFHFHMFSSKLL